MVSVVVILGRNLPIVKHTTPRILTGTQCHTEPLFSDTINTREQKNIYESFYHVVCNCISSCIHFHITRLWEVDCYSPLKCPYSVRGLIPSLSLFLPSGLLWEVVCLPQHYSTLTWQHSIKRKTRHYYTLTHSTGYEHSRTDSTDHWWTDHKRGWAYIRGSKSEWPDILLARTVENSSPHIHRYTNGRRILWWVINNSGTVRYNEHRVIGRTQ